MGGDVDEALRLIDSSMELLSLIERDIGKITRMAQKSEPPSAGTLYSLYSLVTRLRDNLSALRRRLYEAASRDP